MEEGRLECHIMAIWVPVFAAIWGALWCYAVSAAFWSAIFGWNPDLRAQVASAGFGSPFGLSVGLYWWYLRRRREREEALGTD